MSYLAEAQRQIDIPAADLWRTIARMHGMEEWYPGFITQSNLKTTQAGIERRCTLTNGAELHERILVCDERTMTFVYAIDHHPLPASNVVGTIRVDGEDQHSTVSWSARFTADEAEADDTVNMINTLYADGLSSLEAYHRKQNS